MDRCTGSMMGDSTYFVLLSSRYTHLQLLMGSDEFLSRRTSRRVTKIHVSDQYVGAYDSLGVASVKLRT